MSSKGKGKGVPVLFLTERIGEVELQLHAFFPQG
jgi:hypothetical protein